MRRKDREVTDLDEIIEIIKNSETLRLAAVDNGKPYIVPLSFGYTEENGKLAFYFHSAKDGRKIDVIRRNPQVAFETDRCIEIKTDDIACEWTAYYESATGTGTATVAEDESERITGMNAIMKHYGFGGEPQYLENIFDRTCIVKITVTEISGKRNLP